MFALILAMIIWGTLGLFVLKSGLGSIDVAFYRCLIGTIILVPYCWYMGYFKKSMLNLKNAALISLGGIFIVLNWVMLFESFQLASITLGNVSYYLQPVFLVILGGIFFKEKVDVIKWTMIVLSIFGVFMTMDLSTQTFAINNNELLGVVCAIFAGIFYSFATIIAKEKKDISPAVITLLQLTIGTVLLFPFAKLSINQITSPTIYYIITLGSIHTVSAFLLYYYAVKKLPTTSIAVISYIDVFVAILTDVVFFEKTINIIQFSGILLTLLSSYFVINPTMLYFLISKIPRKATKLY